MTNQGQQMLRRRDLARHHDPWQGAGTAVGYYLQDGKEPPGVWAGKAAEALGLTGLVDP